MTSQFNVGDIVRLFKPQGATGTLRRFDTRMVRWVSPDGREIAVRTSATSPDPKAISTHRLPACYFELVRRGHPPIKSYEVGDVVRCHTRVYDRIRYGQDVTVIEMRLGTIGEWLIQTSATGKKEYYARNFHKAPEELQPEKRDTMFVAIKLHENNMADTVGYINHGDVPNDCIKAMADKEQLKRWVADRVASTGEPWVLLYAAQICRPTAQVDWTNAC